MKRRTSTGRWRWALMLPVLVFLLGESSGQREEGRSPRLPAQARYEQAVENALRSEPRQAGTPAAKVAETGAPARLRGWLRSLARLAIWGTYGPRRYSGRERSGLELFHQALLVVGQAVQRLTDLGRFLGLTRQRLGDVTDRRDIAVDLLGYRALFLGGAGNL